MMCLRVCSKTWGRYEKIVHCKEVHLMLSEGTLTADIIDKCVRATWSSKDNCMKYRFTPPTDAKG